jgi:hypothetical protein
VPPGHFLLAKPQSSVVCVPEGVVSTAGHSHVCAGSKCTGVFCGNVQSSGCVEGTQRRITSASIRNRLGEHAGRRTLDHFPRKSHVRHFSRSSNCTGFLDWMYRLFGFIRIDGQQFESQQCQKHREATPLSCYQLITTQGGICRRVRLHRARQKTKPEMYRVFWRDWTGIIKIEHILKSDMHLSFFCT